MRGQSIYWYVIYKAVADFGDLMRDARQARQELSNMADQARAFNAEETAGAAKAAELRRAEIQQLQAESQALRQLGDSAKATNSQLLYGGRSDMQQHLADMDRLLLNQNLLNRAQWLGFSTVQQAMAYRQQMYQQKLLENKAEFGGYLTADQYLAYMAKRVQAANLDTASIQARARAVGDETGAYLAHQNAISGTRQSIGQLGEGVSALGALNSAISALPDAVNVTLNLDDSRFLSELAADRQLLAAVPRNTTWSAEVLPARPSVHLTSGAGAGGGQGEEEAAAALREEMSRLAASALREEEAVGRMISRAGQDFQGGNRYLAPETYRPGGEFARQPGKEMVVKAEFDDVAARSGLQMWVHELLDAVQRRYEFFAVLDDTQALTELDSLMARFRAGETEALRLAAGMGGAAGGGGGGGPPPRSGAAGGAGFGDEERAAAQLREELIRLAAAEDDVRAGAGLATQDFLTEEEAAANLAAMFAALRTVTEDAAAAERGAAAGAKAAGGAIPPMVDGLVASTGGWFGLNSQLRLFGGLMPGVLGMVSAWHVLIDFIIEALAVFVPALVTLAADLIAFGVAGYDAGKQVYDRLVAIHTASDALQQTLAPMTGQLEKLHNTVRPMVWQLYGDAIDIAHSKTGLFNQLAILTGQTVDRLAAHITVFATSASKGLETFFRIGNQDLAKLGTFFDNIGKALLALIRITQETHVDQIFLNFFVVLSQLLVLITKLPTPLLAAAVGLHAFWLWGGLAATVVMQLLGPLRSLALALGAVDAAEVAGGLAGVGKDASAFERLKAGLTDIAAGFGALPGRLGSFSRAAKDASVAAEGVAAGELAMEGGAAGAAGGTEALAGGLGTLLGIPVIGWLLALGAALVGVGVYLGLRTNQTQAWIESLDTALAKVGTFKVVGQTMADLAAVTRQLAESQRLGTGDTTELANAQADLSGKLSRELDHVGQVSHAYGTTMVGALSLLNAAGVKTSDLFTAQGKVWAQDLQQVRGLVDGYKAMGQGMSEIQRDVSVQLVLGSAQYKSMQQLNTAWDNFQKLTAGPFTGIIKTAQDVQALTASTGGMVGLGKAALDNQKNFQGMYTDVETLFSSLRSAEAVTGDNGFSGAVRHAVQALIPLAGGNKAAVAEISQLAQEAGGPATTSLQALSKWAGNTHDPLKALYQDSLNATVGASNLDADAARLTTTLQNDLNPAMANAAFNAMGGQKAFNTFATDLAKFGPNSQAAIVSGRAVASELLSIDKNSASAKAQFVGWAESMGLGRDAANKLWSEVSKGARPMAGLRDQMAQAAGEQAKLAKPGLWGQVEHAFMSMWDRLKAHPISAALFGVLNFIPGFTAAVDAVGHLFTTFFGHTLPDLVTRTLPNLARSVAAWFAGPFTSAVQGAWAHVWSGMVSPVVHVFDSVKHAITSGFDGWWKTHGSALEAIWASTVKDLGFIWDSGSKFLTGSAGKFWGQVEGIFRTARSNVTAIAKDMWHDILLVAEGFWGLFGPVIKSGWAIVEGIFKVAISIIETAMKIGWDALVSAAKIAWALIEAVIKIAWDAIIAIVNVALDVLTGHWRTAWTDIENFGKQVLNALRQFFSQSWNSIKNDTLQAWNAIKSGVTGIWHDIEGAARQVWGNLKQGFSNVVSSIKQTWSTLEGIFRGPVSFLVNNVYDNGIARLWNDVMGAINGPKLPILKFAAGGHLDERGGQLPGFGGGDTVPAWIKGVGPALLEPGEAVIDKHRTRKFAHVLAAMGVPGFAAGGIPGGPQAIHTGTTATPSGGNPLGSILSGIKNILGHAFDLGKIMTALLSGNTNALANALTSLIGPGAAHGELAQMITGVPRAFIKQLMTLVPGLVTKQQAASAGGAGLVSGAGPVGGDEVVNKALARSMFPWDAGQWPAYDTLEMHEAGYNRFAHNPSGAYGIPQALPESKMPFAAQSGGGSHAGPQLGWMFSYIRGRYGTPGNAWAEYYAHPGGVGWYSLGGPVRMASGGKVPVPYLAGFHTGQAHNILAAAGLRPTAAAGQKASWWTTGSAPRATTHVPPHSAVSIHGSASSRPSQIRIPDLAGYTAGIAHNILAAEGLVPSAPRGQKAYWIVTGTRPGRGASAHTGEHVEIIAPAPRTPGPPRIATPPPGTPVPRGSDPGQAWTAYSAQLNAAKTQEADALWTYVKAHRPKLPERQWESDYSDRLILAWQQNKLYGAFNKVMAGVRDPVNMTGGEWTDLEKQAALQQNWIYGGIPPRSVWNAEKTGGPGLQAHWPKGAKPGTYAPSGWPGWKYAHGQWATANSKASVLRTTLGRAFGAWSALYGPGGPLSSGVVFGGGHPGPVVLPAGGPGTPGIGVDLQPLIAGGPSQPVSTSGPSLSATGMGFAGGGMVGGDGASLGQVASMFSLGGLTGGPELASLGLAPRLQQQLAMANAAQGTPRTVSTAAGDHIGVSVGNMTIHNPLPEKPSDTITRSSNRLAFLAGR